MSNFFFFFHHSERNCLIQPGIADPTEQYKKENLSICRLYGFAFEK